MIRRNISDWVQWHGFDAPGVLGLHNGGFMRCYRILPPDQSHASPVQRLQTAERTSHAFRAMRSRLGFHVEEQRVEVRGYPKGQWPTAVSALVDAERERDCLTSGAQFESHHYLTITQKPTERAKAMIRNALVSGLDDGEQAHAVEVSEFQALCDDALGSLGGAVRLRALSDDDTASYLASRVRLRRQRVNAAAHSDLGLQLPVEPFTPGFRLSLIGDRYVAIVSLAGFLTTETHPLLLEELQRARFEYQSITRWLPMERHEAKALLASRKSNLFMEQESMRQSAARAFDKNAKERPELNDKDIETQMLGVGAAEGRLSERGYGHLSNTIIVWEPVTGSSRDAHRAAAKRCRDKALEVRKALSSASLIPRSDTLDSWTTWLGTLPGHLHHGCRKFAVTTRTLADLMPSTTATWTGNRFDRHLAARTGFKRPWMHCAGAPPFDLTADVTGGAAHAIVFGATGQAGKSTFANNLYLQFQGHPGTRVISLSVGRSELGPCLMSGGSVYVIGEETPFQPLAFVDQPNESLAALEWLEACLEANNEPVTPARKTALSDVLRLLAGDVQKRRTMTCLCERLKTRAPDLEQIFSQYTHAGRKYGHIFDGDDANALRRSRWTMFDISRLCTPNARPALVVPAIAHLLHRIEGWIDGTPTLLAMDEFRQWLHHEQLERFTSRLLDTGRKHHLQALLIAQSPDQLVGHPRLLASVLSACAVRLFGPDANATNMPADFARFGVTPEMLTRISKLDLGEFMYHCEGVGTRVFGYRPGKIAKAVTDTTDVALFAQMQAECSDGDELLAAVLEHAGLTAEAKELGWKQSEAKLRVA